MQSQRSALSALSAHSTGSTRRGPRRLTVTAVKVDIVDDHTVTDQLGAHSTRDYDGVDPLFVLPVDTTDEPTSIATRSRTRSITGGVFGHLNVWTPAWTVDGGHGGNRDANVLEQVEEEEEAELGGYSYYDV